MKLEPGWYRFRATVVTKDGSLQAVYSRGYYIARDEDVKIVRNAFIGILTEAGYSDIKISHVTVCDKDAWEIIY